MDSTNKLESYSLDHGDEDDPEKDLILIVESPWNYKKDRVVLIVKNEKTGKIKAQITVLASDLKKAADNCTNCYEFA